MIWPFFFQRKNWIVFFEMKILLQNEYDYTFTQYFMNIRTEKHKNTQLADENYYNNLLKNYMKKSD